MKKVLLILFGILLLTGCRAVANKTEYIKATYKKSSVTGYFEDNLKFYIDSERELDIFNHEYSSDKSNNSKFTEIEQFRNKLGDNTIFVELFEESSGGIELNFKAIDFKDNKISFVIEREVPEVSTTDMAYWFIVAVIPNKELQGMNLSDWYTPSRYYMD